MVPAVSTVEGWGALAAIVGGGGISGIVIAVVGYLTAARSGRQGEPERKAGLAGITAVMADSESFNRVSDSLADVGLAITKFTLLAEGAGHDVGTKAHQIAEKLDGIVEEIRKLRRSIEDRPTARSAQQAAQTSEPAN